MPDYTWKKYASSTYLQPQITKLPQPSATRLPSNPDTNKINTFQFIDIDNPGPCPTYPIKKGEKNKIKKNEKNEL
jgi:hypothetical protein